MTIDCNVTLGHWPFHPLRDNTPEEFVALMDREGIDQAWVTPFEAVFYKGSGPANRALREALLDHGDRFVQLGVIDPSFPGWEDDLEECLEMKTPGFRLYPSYHGYSLDDDACSKALEAISLSGAFLQIVTRIQDDRLHHHLAKVLPVDADLVGHRTMAYPELGITLLNANPMEIRTAMAVGTAPKLRFDISHVDGVGAVGKLAAKIGTERILFGSHAPFFYLQSSLLKMKEADLTDEQREAILEGNARLVLEGK